MSKSKVAANQEDYYRGVKMLPYDLVKELAIATVVFTVLVIALAAIFSSPDVPPLTIASWAQAQPVDFVTTATGELAGTTVSSQYGAPYNSGTGSMQSWGPINPQSWFGVRIPVDSANEFVIQPLTLAGVGNDSLTTALDQYTKATADEQTAWLTAYSKALADAKVADGKVTVADGEYGPVPVMMSNLLAVAQTGGLDGLLLSNGGFFQTDYTRSLLFMGDGTYLSGLAANANLTGSQWGMMNETGQYPGQTWLWLYTMWYQVAPFNRPHDQGFGGLSAANTDLGIIITMTVLTVLLALVPFIPVLRDLPRFIPIHRLIWKRYYAKKAAAPAG
jgi:hypothetical protein